MDIYAQNILAHYQQPHHRGRLHEPTFSQRVKNPYCGDVIELDISLDEQGKVQAVAFEGEGCAISQASMSLLSDELIDRDKSHLEAILAQDIFELLGIKIGPGRIKCALLSLLALRKALNQQTSWSDILKV
ncbi:MAG: hypothetical protein A2788_02025 [Candidatus Abawacabacteria bacterium RIFCSPHIGHO2_01_FULL_46_8]|uniref:NIF system FeS cluster assembly NifU N-terminal domain-containing protein n=1 Tax=Candidatus Abawacabacteria bacterium RIFCSPHIGHO2_01_FULL_46_8 TaxID=1817815 RepID=A0A1F4XIU6_9BACT|nr:MAG: hypothetical protein A2788_02025 [Candidatus Abawacabacteria bacterium RIFCSPHIGHO2_01_FULL_46_8]